MVKKIIIACTLVCMIVMVSSVSLAKTIDRGQRGHHVSKVQTMLKHQGFLHDSIDGIYGHNTEQAVRKFQKSKGLAVDGRVGPATMNALEKMETRYGGHGTERDHNGVPNKYSKVLTMEASGYSSQDPGNGKYTEMCIRDRYITSQIIWSGRRESNPPLKLGKLAFYR